MMRPIPLTLIQQPMMISVERNANCFQPLPVSTNLRLHDNASHKGVTGNWAIKRKVIYFWGTQFHFFVIYFVKCFHFKYGGCSSESCLHVYPHMAGAMVWVVSHGVHCWGNQLGGMLMNGCLMTKGDYFQRLLLLCLDPSPHTHRFHVNNHHICF